MVKSRRAVAANKLLETIEAERTRRIHEKKLREIKTRKRGAQIDNAPPRAMRMVHVSQNLKKRKMQEDRREHIESRNKRTIENLMKIMDRRNPYEIQLGQRARSMNINARRKKLMKINEENKYILERLKRVEPVLSARRLDDEFSVMKKQMKRLRQHVPTIDVYVKKSDKANSPRPGEAVAVAPQKPKGKKKVRGRGRPKLGGRQIHESVLGTGKPPPEAQKASPTTPKGEGSVSKNLLADLKKRVDVSQMNTLRAVFKTVGKSAAHVSKKKLLRAIMMSPAVQGELHNNSDLHHLLKPNRYKAALEGLETDKDGHITLTELVAFTDMLHDKTWEQTLVLKEVFQVILTHTNTPFEDDEHLEVSKKAFIKAVMRDTDVQNLLHIDPVLTVLLKPRKYMAALMHIHPHKEGAISLSELQHFANELHHEGEEGVETLANLSGAPIQQLHKVECRSCVRLRSSTGLVLHLGCVAYVDPFEADDEGDDQSLAIHIEGYELETGKHLNGHGRVDRERFKADGDALVANMLRKMKLEPTGKTKGDQMQLPFRLVV
jgi:hypothetical protein